MWAFFSKLFFFFLNFLKEFRHHGILSHQHVSPKNEDIVLQDHSVIVMPPKMDSHSHVPVRNLSTIKFPQNVFSNCSFQTGRQVSCIVSGGSVSYVYLFPILSLYRLVPCPTFWIFLTLILCWVLLCPVLPLKLGLNLASAQIKKLWQEHFLGGNVPFTLHHIGGTHWLCTCWCR